MCERCAPGPTFTTSAAERTRSKNAFRRLPFAAAVAATGPFECLFHLLNMSIVYTNPDGKAYFTRFGRAAKLPTRARKLESARENDTRRRQSAD